MYHSDARHCTFCGGELVELGQLGSRTHGRCRQCGLDHSWTEDSDELPEDETPEPDDEDSRFDTLAEEAEYFYEARRETWD